MIYFLRAADTVKIGWTKDRLSLNRRISELQCAQPHKLKLVRIIEDAPRWAEGWLHGFFAGLHVAGEWFKYRDDMLKVGLPADRPPKPQKPVLTVGRPGRPKTGSIKILLSLWPSDLEALKHYAASRGGLSLQDAIRELVMRSGELLGAPA